jgi:hypothetical protein
VIGSVSPPVDDALRALASLARKEGPIEIVGHVVLALAAVAWATIAVARARARRPCAAHGALTCFLALVLLEELELSLDLHNAWRGHAWLLFAAAAAVPFLAVGLGAGARERLGANAPRRRDVVAFVAIGAVAVGTTGGAWERPAEEIAELALYLLWLAIGSRRAEGSPIAATGRAP